MKKTASQLNQEVCNRIAGWELSPIAQRVFDGTDFNSIYDLFGDIETPEEFEEFVKENFGSEEANELAERIKNADEWNAEDLAELCEMAGLEKEWQAANGETFEQVAYKAAEILGVEI